MEIEGVLYTVVAAENIWLLFELYCNDWHKIWAIVVDLSQFLHLEMIFLCWNTGIDRAKYFSVSVGVKKQIYYAKVKQL